MQIHPLAASLMAYMAAFSWHILILAKRLLQVLRSIHTSQNSSSQTLPPRIGRGHTVLVTTGRQAKTLHIVRALKDVGATVIVSDYNPISASALSLACDKFILLKPLDSSLIDQWIQHFRSVIVDNHIDLVLPVSTINEVLFIGLAKQRLQTSLPHVKWFCPDLDNALLLDDRVQFSTLCHLRGVPTPDHGILTSVATISNIAAQFSTGIILKRIESTVNRAEEIVCLRSGDCIPEYVNPSSADPWQWQRYIKGQEYSVWYVCDNGAVTFCASYSSQPDLVGFDGSDVCEALDKPLRRLIRHLALTGQYAFDFIIDETGLPFVIECNPRSSSILETVSKTPLWGEAFFGVDVVNRTVRDSVGFLFHRNCWPWASRCEGYFDFHDPLPFFAAEIVWPVNAISQTALLGRHYQHIDVNICKIIVPGPSAGRDIQRFRDEADTEKINYAQIAASHVDTLILDASIPGAKKVFNALSEQGVRVVLFKESHSSCEPGLEGAELLQNGKVSEDFLNKHSSGESRLFLGAALSQKLDVSQGLSFRVIQNKKTWSPANEIPLRRLRVLHLFDCSTAIYYKRFSCLLGRACIGQVEGKSRFEHLNAFVHQTGDLSFETKMVADYLGKASERVSPVAALAKLEALNIDLVVPHLCDWDEFTSYRGIFVLLKIPVIGCPTKTMPLSGLQVATSELVMQVERPLIAVSRCSEVVREASGLGDTRKSALGVENGREVRITIIEGGDGIYEMQPVLEYCFEAELRMEKGEDKFAQDCECSMTATRDGMMLKEATDIDDVLRKKLFTSSVAAVKALGLREYSSFRFRIDAQGETYLTGSHSCCSFMSKGSIATEEKWKGYNSQRLFERLSDQALTRRDVS